MRKNRIALGVSFRLLPLVGALALIPSFVLAQGIATEAQAVPVETPRQLDAVVVSASRSQARVEQMPLHTTIVSQEDIQNSAAQTLDQLLRDVPGLNFTGVPTTQSDPTGHSTKMRGMGNAKVLVLLDGVPIMDPFYLTTQWFKVPLSNIERVEVLRGGNSSLWGNMAVAGVVNVVSKRAKDNAGEASVSLGSRGSSNVTLSKNWVLSDALSFNLAVDQLNSQGYDIAPADQAWRFPGKGPVNAKDSNVQLTTYFKHSSDLSGYVRLGYHIQDQDISYPAGNNLQTSPDISGSMTKKLDEKTTLTGTAWAQYVSFEKFNGAACYWQATAAGTAKDPKCPSTSSTTQIKDQIKQYYTQYGSQRYREQGASAIYAKEIGGFWRSLQVGMDYRHLAATDQEYFYSAPTAITQFQSTSNNVASSATYGKADQAFSGLFAQTTISPAPALELTMSARYDAWTNTDRTNTRTMGTGQPTGGAQADNSMTGLNPSLAGRYVVNDDLALRAATYKSFRAPGFNNMTRTYGSPNPIIANPDIGPENLTGKEIGIDYSKGSLSLGVTYFQYDITNMIATYKVSNYATAPALVQTICGVNFVNCDSGGTNGKYANFYTNDQDGQSHGLELTAQWEVANNLKLNAAFTRTLSTNTRVGSGVSGLVGVQLAATPENMANVSVSWQPQSKLRTNFQARYIGPMIIETSTTAGPTYGVSYEQGGMTIFDASAQYAVTKDTDLTFSVVNLLDKEYSENAYTHDQPWNRTLSSPRTFNVGVKVRF